MKWKIASPAPLNSINMGRIGNKMVLPLIPSKKCPYHELALMTFRRWTDNHNMLCHHIGTP
jgi:hypothetical protein